MVSKEKAEPGGIGCMEKLSTGKSRVFLDEHYIRFHPTAQMRIGYVLHPEVMRALREIDGLTSDEIEHLESSIIADLEECR